MDASNYCLEQGRTNSHSTGLNSNMPRRFSASKSISTSRHSDASPGSRSHPRDCRCSACRLRGDSPASRSDGERLSPALTRALAREQIGLESSSATPSPTNRSLSPAISCTSHSSIGDDISHSSSPDHRNSPQTRGRRIHHLPVSASHTPASTCSSLSTSSTSRILSSSVFPPISTAHNSPTIDHDSDADLTPESHGAHGRRPQLRLCKPSSHSQHSSHPLHRDAHSSGPYQTSHHAVCSTLLSCSTSMSPNAASQSSRMPHVQTLPDLPHRPMRLASAVLRRSKTESNYTNSPGSPLRLLSRAGSQNNSPSSRQISAVFEVPPLSIQDEESKVPRSSSDSTSGNVSPPLTPTARPQRNALPLQLPQTPFSPEVVIPTSVSGPNKALRGISALPDFDAEIVRDLHRRSNENREQRLRRHHETNSPSLSKLRPSISDNSYEMSQRPRLLNPLASPPNAADDFIQSPEAMNHSYSGRPLLPVSVQSSSLSKAHPSVTASAPTPSMRSSLPPPLHLPPSAMHTETLIAKPLDILPLETIDDSDACHGGESERSDGLSDAGSLCSQCDCAEAFSRIPVTHPRPLSLTPLKQPRPNPDSTLPFTMGPSALSLCLPSASAHIHGVRPRLASLPSAADSSSICLMPCPPSSSSLPRNLALSSTPALATSSQSYTVNHRANRSRDLHELVQAGVECEAGADGQAL